MVEDPAFKRQARKEWCIMWIIIWFVDRERRRNVDGTGHQTPLRSELVHVMGRDLLDEPSDLDAMPQSWAMKQKEVREGKREGI